jgi:hypothetical protein
METRSSATFEMLKVVARGLGSLRERVVFLGGAATSLLITDPALPHIWTTLDVDVIVEVLSRMDYCVSLSTLWPESFSLLF